MHTLYLITNLLDKKVYIGQTKLTLQRRFNIHKANSNKQCKRLVYAMDKHGRDNFIIEPIIIVNTQIEIDQEEMYWIAKMREVLGNKSVYNIKDGGQGNRGPVSESTKLKMRLAHLGKVVSKETKQKLSESHKGQIAWNKGLSTPWTKARRDAQITKQNQGVTNG